MTVTYGFYDSLSGDRKYNAEQMGRMFEGVIIDGVFQYVGGKLIPTNNSGMTIKVASGRAWFNNTWLLNDADLVLTVPASHASLPRIDTVVLEVNKTTRINSLKIIAGTAATVPVAATLSTTSPLFQYAIGYIAVGAAVVTINSGDVNNLVGTGFRPYASFPVVPAGVFDILAAQIFS